MLEILEAIENELPTLLQDEQGWKSLKIDYHPPFVDRVYRQRGDYRICLHRIHPCGPGEALFHPHPWPSAMHIFSGVYEMAVGYGAGNDPPPEAAKLIARGDLKYEMTNRDAWHYVRPIDEVAMTIMITGPLWDRWSPGRMESLSRLEENEAQEILNFFRDRFPVE